MREDCLIAALCLLALVGAKAERSSDDHWVWRTYNRHERAFREDKRNGGISNSYDGKYRRELFSREPTTKRPLPGEPENDEIEDYADIEPTKPSTSNVGTRQFSPYGGGAGPGGIGLFNGAQFPGQGGGAYGAYPSGVGNGYGSGNPAVLVGPGGPTGIIGRPQQQFPNAYQPGYGGFNGAQNGLAGYPGVYGGGAPGAGFNGIGGLPGGGAAGAGIGAGFNGIGGLPGGGAAGAGFNGLPGGSGFPGAGSQGGFAGYPGAQTVIGQFPAGGQYPFAQYPGAEFNGNQYAAGGQYPGQYPGSPYAGNAGPQYTEGYGLASPNGQLGIYGPSPNLGLGGLAFDEKRDVAVAEGKSAKSVQVEGRSPASSAVNDKLHKKL